MFYDLMNDVGVGVYLCSISVTHEFNHIQTCLHSEILETQEVSLHLGTSMQTLVCFRKKNTAIKICLGISTISGSACLLVHQLQL